MDTNEKFRIIYNSDEEGRKKLLDQMTEEEQAFYHEWAKQQARPAAIREDRKNTPTGKGRKILAYVMAYVLINLASWAYGYIFTLPNNVRDTIRENGCIHGLYMTDGTLMNDKEIISYVRKNCLYIEWGIFPNLAWRFEYRTFRHCDVRYK